MKMLRYLLRNLNTLNLMLVAVFLVILKYLAMPALIPQDNFKTPAPKKAAVQLQAAASDNKTSSPLDYALIAEQNLFHPERKIPIESKDDNQAPKPEFVLYGILATEDTMIVYLEDKKSSSSSPGRGKRQQALKRGDTLSGFKLESIEEDRIVMTRGEEKITVLIDEKQRQRQKAVTGSGGTEHKLPQQTQPQRQPIVVQPKK
ncbi:MAG: hypothetical protein HQL10_00690 [Nitrospirae bacterium]|nr:hypothetical protein [Nitrospirota bacterium]